MKFSGDEFQEKCDTYYFNNSRWKKKTIYRKCQWLTQFFFVGYYQKIFSTFKLCYIMLSVWHGRYIFIIDFENKGQQKHTILVM